MTFDMVNTHKFSELDERGLGGIFRREALFFFSFLLWKNYLSQKQSENYAKKLENEERENGGNRERERQGRSKESLKSRREEQTST